MLCVSFSEWYTKLFYESQIRRIPLVKWKHFCNMCVINFHLHWEAVAGFSPKVPPPLNLVRVWVPTFVQYLLNFPHQLWDMVYTEGSRITFCHGSGFTLKPHRKTVDADTSSCLSLFRASVSYVIKKNDIYPMVHTIVGNNNVEPKKLKFTNVPVINTVTKHYQHAASIKQLKKKVKNPRPYRMPLM